MTALRTKLARPKEVFWSIVICVLAGIGAYVVTYHSLAVAFRPAAGPWVSPASAVTPATSPPCPDGSPSSTHTPGLPPARTGPSTCTTAGR